MHDRIFFAMVTLKCTIVFLYFQEYLTILTGKTVFLSTQYKNLLKQKLLTFFLCLRNQLIRCLYVLLSHIKEYRCLKNVIHQIDRNEWLLLSAFQKSLRQNIEYAFGLTQENAFSQKSLKPTEKAYVVLKSGTRDFYNSPPFGRLTCFYVTITGNFEAFQYFNFETNFWKNANIFRKK